MQRESALEWLRVVAAGGIVWFHAGVTGSHWGYAGLVVFLVLSLMFEAGSNVSRPTSMPKLAVRLILPWIFWWGVYAGFNVIRHHPIVDDSHGILLGMLASPSIHLWYLPFVFMVLVLFGAAKGKLSTPSMAIGAAAIAGMLIWLIPFWVPASLGLGRPLPQWAHACAPIFFGILIGCAMRARWPWALSAPIVLLLIWACYKPFPDVGPIYLLGLSIVVAVMALPLSARQKLPMWPALSSSMLGVYLVHPLVLAVLRPLINRSEIAGVMVTFAVSAVGVLLVRWLLPWPASLFLGTSMTEGQGHTVFRSGVVASIPSGLSRDPSTTEQQQNDMFADEVIANFQKWIDENIGDNAPADTSKGASERMRPDPGKSQRVA